MEKASAKEVLNGHDDTKFVTPRGLHKFLLEQVYPVGSIYMSMSLIDPSVVFGGKWERLGGKFLLGATTGNETDLGNYGYVKSSSGYWYHTNNNGERLNINNVGLSYGETAHKLTVDEMPSHNHNNLWPRWGTNAGANAIYGSNGDGYGSDYNDRFFQGGDKVHNNMPPYLVVYMWKRVS